MQLSEIPLSPDNQRLVVTISGVNYLIQLIWRDHAGWVLDLMDSSRGIIISNLPLVTGADLLDQYAFLNLNFGLIVHCDESTQPYPVKTDLGIGSHVYVITE